mgnify:CR=1 FL=1
MSKKNELPTLPPQAKRHMGIKAVNTISNNAKSTIIKLAKIEPIGSIPNLTINTGKVHIDVDKLIENELITKFVKLFIGTCFLLQKSSIKRIMGWERTKMPTVESTVNHKETEYTEKGLTIKITTNANPMEFRLSASLSKSLLTITIPTSIPARITDTPNPVTAE